MNFKFKRRLKIKKKIRKNIFGTISKPRLSVYKSNRYIYAQLINDSIGHTIISISSQNKFKNKKISKSEKSFLIGKELGKKIINIGIKKIIFDRNGFLYHGIIKKLAEGSRESGLIF